MNRYLSGGLEALLKKNRGGRRRFYTTQEEEDFLKEQLSSSLNREVVTVNILKDYQTIRLMYQDEAGFGRFSERGPCWAPKGYRPHLASHPMREYCYYYGAVDAHAGDSIILVMDNAIWHKSQLLTISETIALAFIPPYPPEMNPIVKVWAEICKLGFKNKVFTTLNVVIDKLQEVIQTLAACQLKSIVRRDWTSVLKANNLSTTKPSLG